MFKLIRRINPKSLVNRKYATQTGSSPLEGIRILDLTRVLAGPFATMIMSDLGAEVIKIERPGVGDDTRSWGPPFIEGETRESAYFLSVNRNKKSLCIDIKSKQGQKVLHELAAKCDVMIENYVPGKLDSMGLGYEDIRETNPALIYCSITGFGSDGPYSTRGGYDVIAASMGGLMHVTGAPDGPPAKVGVAMTDLMTALYAHGAILAALLQREKTGEGQKIECNLLSTQVSAMTHLASNWLNAGMESSRWGTAHASIVPYQTFATKDGYMTVGCGNNNQFAQFCERIGKSDLATMDEYRNNENRVQHREKLLPSLSAILSTKNNTEWCALFEGVSFPYGPVNSMAQVFEDPQVLHNGLKKSIDHSTIGRIATIGPAVKYTKAENMIRSPPPTLGQHSKQVLEEILGYSKQDIEQLRNNKVIA